MVTGVAYNVFDGDQCHRQCLWWWSVSLTMSLMVISVTDNVFYSDRCRRQCL